MRTLAYLNRIGARWRRGATSWQADTHCAFPVLVRRETETEIYRGNYQAVPEPGSTVLLIGFAACCLLRRKRQSKAVFYRLSRVRIKAIVSNQQHLTATAQRRPRIREMVVLRRGHKTNGFLPLPGAPNQRWWAPLSWSQKLQTEWLKRSGMRSLPANLGGIEESYFRFD